MTGIPTGAQSIRVYDTEDAASASSPSGVDLSDDDKPIGFYGVTQGNVLKVNLIRVLTSCIMATMSIRQGRRHIPSRRLPDRPVYRRFPG